MFVEKMENINKFEVGGVYAYAFACNSESYHRMQIVSISATRKTAIIRDYYGENHFGKEYRKKIYINSYGEEAISAGNYSMAGSWYASERDSRRRNSDFDIGFMHATESKSDLEALGMPEENNTAARFTVSLSIDKSCAKFEKMELSVTHTFLTENAEKLKKFGIYSITWDLYDSQNENGYSIAYGFINATNNFDLMKSIENECPDEYGKILFTCAAEIFSVEQFGEIVDVCNDVAGEVMADIMPEITDRPEIIMTSATDNDPDPDNDPTPSPDKDTAYSDFDNTFRACNIISVSFGGAQNSAEASTEKRQLEKIAEKLNDDITGFDEVSEPEQPLENQISFDDVAYSKNEQPEQAAAVSPINEELARWAHESHSFSDYKTGSATAEYNAQVAEVAELAEKVKSSAPEEFHSEIDSLVSRYTSRLAEWTNRRNRIENSCPSWFVSGPANYPMRKFEKQQAALKNCYDDLEKIEHIKARIKNFANRPIMSGDESAIYRLTEKVENLRKEREEMKQKNAEARKAGKTAPYGSYTLSNSLANLRTAEKRLEELKKAKETPTAAADDLKNEFCEVVRNTDIMRLQLIFSGKPDDETRNILKSNGFKWAPSQKAWQRQLNNNAVYAAKRVFSSLAELTAKS